MLATQTLRYLGNVDSTLNLRKDSKEFLLLSEYFKNRSVEVFRRKIESCKLCSRFLDYKKPLPPKINLNSRFLFISKEPTLRDLKSSLFETFETSVQDQFSLILKHLGILDYSLTNIVNCHGKNYRGIDFNEFSKCSLLKLVEFLFYKESVVDTIFLLGKDAVDYFIGNRFSPNRDLGSYLQVDVLGKKYKTYILQHPVFLQQRPEYRKPMYDILNIIYRDLNSRGSYGE